MNSPTRMGLALVPLALLLVPGLSAQQKQPTFDQAEMKAKYAEMQTEPWFTGGGWVTDFDAAKKTAAETGRPIFAYFTRTYAY